MTRRNLLRNTFITAATQLSCSRGLTSILERVLELETWTGLAVLTRDFWAFTKPHVRVGHLDLNGYCGIMAISSDASKVAWVPLSEVDPEQTQGFRGFVRSEGDEIAFRYKGRIGGALSVSSRLDWIAMTLFDGHVGQLLVSSIRTSDVLYDLTRLMEGFTLTDIMTLRVCDDLSRAIVGTRSEFRVLDLPRQATVFRSTGRFPALSPDGKRLAFVDKYHRLYIRDLNRGISVPTAPGLATYGVGTWSPDGAFLLVGTQSWLSASKRLSVLDTEGGGYSDLVELGEGDFGNLCCWIKRKLLS